MPRNKKNKNRAPAPQQQQPPQPTPAEVPTTVTKPTDAASPPTPIVPSPVADLKTAAAPEAKKETPSAAAAEVPKTAEKPAVKAPTAVDEKPAQEAVDNSGTLSKSQKKKKNKNKNKGNKADEADDADKAENVPAVVEVVPEKVTKTPAEDKSKEFLKNTETKPVESTKAETSEVVVDAQPQKGKKNKKNKNKGGAAEEPAKKPEVEDEKSSDDKKTATEEVKKIDADKPEDKTPKIDESAKQQKPNAEPTKESTGKNKKQTPSKPEPPAKLPEVSSVTQPKEIKPAECPLINPSIQSPDIASIWKILDPVKAEEIASPAAPVADLKDNLSDQKKPEQKTACEVAAIAAQIPIVAPVIAKAEVVKTEAPKQEGGKSGKKQEKDKSEAPKPETTKVVANKAEIVKPEASKLDEAKPEPTKAEKPKPEAAKTITAKPEPAKPETAAIVEAAKPDASIPEAPKPESIKQETKKPEATKPESPKVDLLNAEAVKPEAPKAEAAKLAPEPTKQSDKKQAKPVEPKAPAPKSEIAKPEAKPEAIEKPEAKPEAVKLEENKPEAPKSETITKPIITNFADALKFDMPITTPVVLSQPKDQPAPKSPLPAVKPVEIETLKSVKDSPENITPKPAAQAKPLAAQPDISAKELAITVAEKDLIKIDAPFAATVVATSNTVPDLGKKSAPAAAKAEAKATKAEKKCEQQKSAKNELVEVTEPPCVEIKVDKKIKADAKSVESKESSKKSEADKKPKEEVPTKPAQKNEEKKPEPAPLVAEVQKEPAIKPAELPAEAQFEKQPIGELPAKAIESLKELTTEAVANKPTTEAKPVPEPPTTAAPKAKSADAAAKPEKTAKTKAAAGTKEKAPKEPKAKASDKVKDAPAKEPNTKTTKTKAKAPAPPSKEPSLQDVPLTPAAATSEATPAQSTTSLDSKNAPGSDSAQSVDVTAIIGSAAAESLQTASSPPPQDIILGKDVNATFTIPATKANKSPPNVAADAKKADAKSPDLTAAAQLTDLLLQSKPASKEATPAVKPGAVAGNVRTKTGAASSAKPANAGGKSTGTVPKSGTEAKQQATKQGTPPKEIVTKPSATAPKQTKQASPPKETGKPINNVAKDKTPPRNAQPASNKARVSPPKDQKSPANNNKPAVQARTNKTPETTPKTPTSNKPTNYNSAPYRSASSASSASNASNSSNSPSPNPPYDDEEYVEFKFSPRPVYMATICQVCKVPLPSHVLCKLCQMVSYCSVEHLHEDAAAHAPLCAAIQEIAKKRGGHVYNNARILNDDDYRSLRVHTLNLCENALQRHLQPFEREILLFPRLCATGTCREWRQQLLVECKSCGQVSFCAEHANHLPVGHSRWCQAFALYQKLVFTQKKYGRIEPSLPSKIMTKPYQLPATMDETFKSLYKNYGAIKDDCTYAALTQLATAPLTAYYGLQRAELGAPIGERFTIHLVGAELQFEADTLDKWETFFLHLVPQLVELRVTFVGPELNAENLPLEILSRIRMCRTCRQNCRAVKFDFQCGMLYHNYVKSSAYAKPDLICFFNPGLYRATGFNGVDTWPETIRAAAAHKVPIIVTSYTEVESPRDLERLQREATGADLSLVLAPHVNPFSSQRPERNFISDEVAPMIFKNYFCFVCK